MVSEILMFNPVQPLLAVIPFPLTIGHVDSRMASHDAISMSTGLDSLPPFGPVWSQIEGCWEPHAETAATRDLMKYKRG